MQSLRKILAVALLLAMPTPALACGPGPEGAASPEVLARAEAIAEPALEGIRLERELLSNLLFRPVAQALNPRAWLRGLLPRTAREAGNVDSMDEVPDSTWFRRRRRNEAPRVEVGAPPRPPFVVESRKGLGSTPGLTLRDAVGERWLLKFDDPAWPEMATGSEVVAARLVEALGWRVPDYHLVEFLPSELVLAVDASLPLGPDVQVPMLREDLDELFAEVAKDASGRVRASASRFVPGVVKGPFRDIGTRPDDPTDLVPHEDRRDLRGFGVVAAWLNHIDARRGNTLDAFVPVDDSPGALGHLWHYWLDFSGALGSAQAQWVGEPRPRVAVSERARWVERLSFGWIEAEQVELTHRLLGYLRGANFDPEVWQPTLPNPIFARATWRDRFWGARQVARLDPGEILEFAAAGAWSDPQAAAQLTGALLERRRRIAETYFDHRRMLAAENFRIEARELRFDDLARRAEVVDGDPLRYRWRLNERIAVTAEARWPLADVGVVEVSASVDGGRSWGPPTRVWIETGFKLRAVARCSR